MEEMIDRLREMKSLASRICLNLAALEAELVFRSEQALGPPGTENWNARVAYLRVDIDRLDDGCSGFLTYDEQAERLPGTP